MIESMKARWTIIALVLILAVVVLLPNFVDMKGTWLSKSKIIYGLDIQGGTHLVMGVDVKNVLVEKIARLANTLQVDFKDRGINAKSVQVSGEDKTEITVELADSDSISKFNKYLNDYYGTMLQKIRENGTTITVKYLDTQAAEYKKQVVSQAIEVIRNRIDEFGVSEPSISAQGEDRILVQLPGIKDAARAKELINRTAKLDFRAVSIEVSPEKLSEMILEAEKAGNYALGKDGLRYAAYVKRINDDLKSKLPANSKVVFEKSPAAVNLEAGKVPLLLVLDSDLNGGDLEDAHVRSDEFGKPEVIFSFTPEGRRKFADLTEKYVRRQVAIVLDDVVQSAPSINERIDSPSARITLGSRGYQDAIDEAQFIATALRAGALPAALEQLEERTVGPSVGADAIQKGKMAGLIGALFVFLFMLIYYRFLGVVADLALIFNIVLLLAGLTILGATLTLPGVAGIVLTIGMAVDANIIIYERIRDEMRLGVGVQKAIRDGFDNAFSAIFDANIVTVCACVILIYFGTGPVRGFGVTLIIGLVTSMFTAIFVTRTAVEFLVRRFNIQKVI